MHVFQEIGFMWNELIFATKFTHNLCSNKVMDDSIVEKHGG
jgi:hypothetical protein